MNEKITYEEILLLDNELHNYIRNDRDIIDEYGIELMDLIHTYIYPNEILNDWDEGKDNDPFWDIIRDQHSAISLINDICFKIKRDKKINQIIN